MKNERRHKLAQNSLASFLEKTIKSIQEQSATITWFLLVLVIALLLLLLWRTFASKNKQGFYNDMKQLAAFNMSELDGEQFDNTVKSYMTKYPSGVNNAAVSLLIGDIYFNRASAVLAEGKRDQAIAHYETALGYYTTADTFQFKQQEPAESAVWGLAQTSAALAALKEGGDYMVAAKDSYERLCKTWPDGVRFELATEQAVWRNRPIMADFPAKYRQSAPVLFAPNMQVPDTTQPFGDLDTTIIPGDFQGLPDDSQDDIQSFLEPMNVQGETPEREYDAGLPEPDSITLLEPDTQETPVDDPATQDSEEQQNPEP